MFSPLTSFRRTICGPQWVICLILLNTDDALDLLNARPLNGECSVSL